MVFLKVGRHSENRRHISIWALPKHCCYLSKLWIVKDLFFPLRIVSISLTKIDTYKP